MAFTVTAGAVGACLLVLSLLALFRGRAQTVARVADGTGIEVPSETSFSTGDGRDVGATASAGLGVRETGAADEVPAGDKGVSASGAPVAVSSPVPAATPVAPEGVTSADPPTPSGASPVENPATGAAATTTAPAPAASHPESQPRAAAPIPTPEPSPVIKSFLAQRKALLAAIREQKTAQFRDDMAGREVEISKKIHEGNTIVARARQELERELSKQKAKRSKPEMKALRKAIADEESRVKKLGKQLADLEKRPDELLKEGLERIDHEMAELGSQLNPGLVLQANNLTVGMVGVLLSAGAVASGSGGPAAREGTRGQGSFYNVKVFQVIDDRNFLAEPTFGAVRGRTALIWIKGVSTEGMTDGSPQRIEDVLFVSGTKLYTTTARGTKTVFVLEPVDLEEAGKYLAERSAPNGTAPADAVAE